MQTRRDFLRRTAATAALAGLVPGLAFADPPTGDGKRKPNVVVLFIDDLGYGDVGCFGCPDIPTPHMDALAARGVKCTWSYITNPPCSPSRCCLMTGMYAQRFGKSGMARGLPIPTKAEHPTFAETMAAAGYVTGMVGRWDIGREQGPLARGFQEVSCDPPVAKGSKGPSYHRLDKDGKEAYLTDLQAGYLEEFVDRNQEKPFFLYFAPLGVHSPVGDAPQRYQDRAPKVQGRKRKGLAGSIIAIDDAIGRLLTKLDEHGLREDTLILFTGDNGGQVKDDCRQEPFRGGKGLGTQQEGWVHTPTIISWPGTLPEGRTWDGMMCTMDFYATAAAVAGTPLPERCEGVDLRPFLKGDRQGNSHDELFWYNADPEDDEHRHLQAMRWEQWRLVKLDGTWKLFDLHADPKELKDVASANPEVFERMKTRHAEWVATLPPIRLVSESKGFEGPGGNLETGWGWSTAAGHPTLPRKLANPKLKDKQP